MSLTKAEITKRIQDDLDCSKQKAVGLLETIIELITSTLENDEDVLVSGFGKLCVREKNERRGRNPETDEQMMLRARRVVTFRCSGKLRKRVNGDVG